MFGLRDEIINSLKDIFRRYSSIDEVIIYGSRAKGSFRKGSDIDLTLIGDDIDLKVQYEVEEDIEALELPYLFDLSIYNHIDNDNLREHIDRIGKIFYRKESSEKCS